MPLGDDLYAALDATAGDADANSYATVAEADDYHDGLVAGHMSVWTAASPTQKAQSLMWATKLLDAWVEWDGVKATATQRLKWPRIDVFDDDLEEAVELDSDTIPDFLKEATSELARNLIAKDLTKEPLRGIKDIKVGSIGITFDMTNQKRVLLKSVKALIMPYGRTVEAGRFSRQAVRV